MDTATNDWLVRLTDAVTELTVQVGALEVENVDVERVKSKLSKIRRELIETELSD